MSAFDPVLNARSSGRRTSLSARQRRSRVDPAWLDRPVIELDGHPISIGLVMAAALLTFGLVDELVRDVTEGLACATAAEVSGNVIPTKELQRGVDGWRATRRVHAAEDFEAWLKDNAVDLSDLIAFVERRLLRERHGPSTAAIAARIRPPIDHVYGLVPLEMLFSGSSRRVIEAIAKKLILGTRSCDGAERARARAQIMARHGLDRPVGHARFAAVLGIDETMLAWVLDIDAGYRVALRRLVTPTTLADEIARNQRELTTVELVTVSFTSEDAAHEAMVCSKEDHVPLEHVAHALSLPHERTQTLVGEVDRDPLLSRLASAVPGELLGPLSSGRPPNRVHRVVQVVRRIAPHADDARVVRCIRRSIVDRELRADMHERLRVLEGVE